MRIELLATGNELLNGRSVNTHARALGGRLTELGLALARETTVPDELDALAGAMREALARAEVLIVTGGLGPTCDDLTRDALAALLGRALVPDPTSLEALRARYRAMGRPLTASRERQALIVEGATALANPVGVAPGQRLDWQGRTLFLLPGPPNEFYAILDAEVLPWLQARVAPEDRLHQQLFMVCGLGESDIVDRLEAGGFQTPEGVALAYCAAPGKLEVRLTAPAARRAAAQTAAETLRRLLAPHSYAEERIELAECVVRRLRAAGTTVAVAESCTGGLIGHKLTDVPGSSAVFRGGVVAYANEVKQAGLGVPPELLADEGAVSAPVAARMAQGVRERLGADYGLSVTGIAGPGGGTKEKPVGLVYIGLADAQGVRTRRFLFQRDRALNKEWSAQMALDLLRRRLQGVDEEDPTP